MAAVDTEWAPASASSAGPQMEPHNLAEPGCPADDHLVHGVSGSPWLRTRGLPGCPSNVANGGQRSGHRGIAERRSASGHVSPRPPSASPAAGIPRPGTADSAARRQFDALEERFATSIAALHRQQVADRQETDRLAELSASRLEARLGKIEQQQLRLERRSAELAGVVRGVCDEQQAQDRRTEQLSERLRSMQMTSQAQEEGARRLAELEEEHKALAGVVQSAAAADEEVQRRYMQRFRQVELQVEDQIRMALGGGNLQVGALEERLEALEALCKSGGVGTGNTLPGATSTPLRSVHRGAQLFAENAGPDAVGEGTIGRLTEALGESCRSVQNPLASDEALLAVQELEAALNQELQVIHERCNFVQDCLEERVLGPIRRIEQKVTDHEMKVEQLLSDGQDRSAKVEEHEVRLGVTRSKIDAHEQRLSLVSDRVDRALRAEKAAAAANTETGSPNGLGFARLAPSALSSQASLSQHLDAGVMPGSSGTLGGVTSIVALERRLLLWESTVEELQLQHQQQASANKEMASTALHKADSACVEIQELSARLSGDGPSTALLAARFDELEALLRQSLANLNSRTTEAAEHWEALAARIAACEDTAANAMAEAPEALRRELAERLTELARHAQAGFTDVREHLDTVSRQLGQLRARVQHNEDGISNLTGSQVPAAAAALTARELEATPALHGAMPGVPGVSSSAAPPGAVAAGGEATAALRDLEVRVRENEAFAGTLRQGMVVIQQILSDVKRTIDVALVERRDCLRSSVAASSDDDQASAAVQHELAARIARAEAAVNASVEELAAVRDRPSISPEEVGAVEQRLLQASERTAAQTAHQANQELQRLAADAEVRLQANEAATAAVQKRLDDLPLSLGSLPSRLATFEERLLQSEASARRDLQQSETSGHQALLTEIDRRHAWLVAALLGTPTQEGNLKGDAESHTALANFGAELRALLRDGGARLQQAEQNLEAERQAAQQSHASAAAAHSENAIILQRVERAEHDLEEQRRVFQWLQNDRELEEHRRMLQLQAQPMAESSEAALQPRCERLERDLAEQRRCVQQHDKSLADIPAIHKNLEARLEAGLEVLDKRLALAENELQEKFAEDRQAEHSGVLQRLARLESGFEEQRSGTPNREETGHSGVRADAETAVATRASVEELSASVTQLQHELVGLRGAVDRQQRLAGLSEGWDGWTQHTGDIHLGRSVSASSTGLSVHQPAPDQGAEAAGGHGSGAASSAAAASAAAAAASAGTPTNSAASHVEDAEAGGGGPAVGSSAGNSMTAAPMPTRYVEDAEAGGGGRVHGTPAAAASTDAEAAGGGPTSRATVPPAPSRPASSAHSSSSAVTQRHISMSRWEGAEAETRTGIHLGMADAETSAGPSPSPGQARRLLAVQLREGAEAAGGFPAPGPSPASASSAQALHTPTAYSEVTHEGEGDGAAGGSAQPVEIQPSDAGGGPGPAAAGQTPAAVATGLPPARDAVAGSGGAEADAGGGDAEAEDVSSSQWGQLLSAIQERLRPERPTNASSSTASSGPFEHPVTEMLGTEAVDAAASTGAGDAEDTMWGTSADVGVVQTAVDGASTTSEASRHASGPTVTRGEMEKSCGSKDAGRSDEEAKSSQEPKPARHLSFVVSGPAVSQRGEVFFEDMPSGRHSTSSSSSPTGRAAGSKSVTDAAGADLLQSAVLLTGCRMATHGASAEVAESSPTGDAAKAAGSAGDADKSSADVGDDRSPRGLQDEVDAIESFGDEPSEADYENDAMSSAFAHRDADADEDLLQESLNSDELLAAAATLSPQATEDSIEEFREADARGVEFKDPAPLLGSSGSISCEEPTEQGVGASRQKPLARPDTTLTSFVLDEGAEDPLANLGFGESDEDGDASVEEEILVEEVPEVALTLTSAGPSTQRHLLEGSDGDSSEDEIEDTTHPIDIQVARAAAAPAMPSLHGPTPYESGTQSSEDEVEVEFAAAARAQQWGRANQSTSQRPARMAGLALDMAPRSDAPVSSARGTLETPRSVASVLEVEMREISDDDSDAEESGESDDDSTPGRGSPKRSQQSRPARAGLASRPGAW